MKAELPPEHKGHTHTRMWHKVKWIKNPHPEKKEWQGVVGKVDLMMDEDLRLYKDFVHVIENARVETCVTGLALGFGKLNEEQIDGWLKNNSL